MHPDELCFRAIATAFRTHARNTPGALNQAAILQAAILDFQADLVAVREGLSLDEMLALLRLLQPSLSSWLRS